MIAKQNDYDLAITGGRVIDPETGLDAIRNVGIKGEKIAAVTDQPISRSKENKASMPRGMSSRQALLTCTNTIRALRLEPS